MRQKTETKKPKRNVYDRAAGGQSVHEADPAQERGERIELGKAIARGGHRKGHVSGASRK